MDVQRKILENKKKVMNRFESENLLPVIKPKDFTTKLSSERVDTRSIDQMIINEVRK
jgi:hypothetical protein